MWGFGQPFGMPFTPQEPQQMPVTVQDNTGLKHDEQVSSASQQPKAAHTIPPEYVVVPAAYLQQMQMVMSQMYSQISSLTTAQNALQQAFQTLASQQKSHASPQTSSLPESLNVAELARFINNHKQQRNNSKLKRGVNLENIRSRKNGKGSPKAKAPGKENGICRFFKKGDCKLGDKCEFAHGKATSNNCTAMENLKVYDFSVDKAPVVSDENVEVAADNQI